MTHEGQISEQVPNPFADGQWESTSYYARYESPTLRSRRVGYVPIAATVAVLALAGLYQGASAQGNCSDLVAGGTYEEVDAESAVYGCTKPDGTQGYLRPRTGPTLDCEALDAQSLRATVDGSYRDTCVTNGGETQGFTFNCEIMVGNGLGELHPDGSSLCTDAAGALQPLTQTADLTYLPQPAVSGPVAETSTGADVVTPPQDEYTVAERAADLTGIGLRLFPLWGPAVFGGLGYGWLQRRRRVSFSRDQQARMAAATEKARRESEQQRQARQDYVEKTNRNPYIPKIHELEALDENGHPVTREEQTRGARSRIHDDLDKQLRYRGPGNQNPVSDLTAALQRDRHLGDNADDVANFLGADTNTVYRIVDRLRGKVVDTSDDVR